MIAATPEAPDTRSVQPVQGTGEQFAIITALRESRADQMHAFYLGRMWGPVPMPLCFCGEPVQSRLAPHDRYCQQHRFLDEAESAKKIVRKVEADCGAIVAAAVLGYTDDH